MGDNLLVFSRLNSAMGPLLEGKLEAASLKREEFNKSGLIVREVRLGWTWLKRGCEVRLPAFPL